MKRKRLIALLLTAAMTGSLLAGCGSSGGDSGSGDSEATGKVYYLNFKPEQADQWVELAQQYTDETGVQVDVQTAASGTYESQLKSEMAKDEAPTLFQVNGPVGLATWKITATICQTARFTKMYQAMTMCSKTEIRYLVLRTLLRHTVSFTTRQS